MTAARCSSQSQLLKTVSWLRRERITDGSSFLLSRAKRNPFRLRSAWLPDQAEHHHDFHVDRVDAEWRQPVVRGFRGTVALVERAGIRVFRDGGGGG